VSFLGVRFDRNGDFVASAACLFARYVRCTVLVSLFGFLLKKILLPVHSARKLLIYCMVSLT